jgi:hypothetical protein
VCKSNSVNCWLYLYIGDPCARGGSHATTANRETSAALHGEALLHLHATPHGRRNVETKAHVCGLIPRILFRPTTGMASIPRQVGSPTRCLAHKTDPAQYACHRELPTTKASCEANDSIVSPGLCVHPQHFGNHLHGRHGRRIPSLRKAPSPQQQPTFSPTPHEGCLKSLDEQRPVSLDVHGIAFNPLSVSCR